MDEDLKEFKEAGVDMRVALERAKSMFSHRGSQCWCHYAVKDGEIYRQCYGQHVGFSMFWDNVLAWLSRRAVLPDLEMLVNLGMYPCMGCHASLSFTLLQVTGLLSSLLISPSPSPHGVAVTPPMTWCSPHMSSQR